ncbi:discoidin cub egf laminin and zinc metalloprotease domain containing [Holotrichia oblita]|uniref:Discoidin cub egf laminin and zinc metalloprotease domain containing n=1 Tax=Holotrichia oblita TaxID=644536 RepID=A0ACB9SHL5_HOLOL|nr:discoidin cub egf laminin and zinc metalloprotease domain containing [Holotrichia oblita]
MLVSIISLLILISSIYSFPTVENNEIDVSHYGAALFGKPNEKTGEIVNEWASESSQVNPEELGEYLEGDILVPAKGRNGLLDFSSKWDGGMVPYVIVGPYNSEEQEVIHNAIKQYHDNTCIRFRRKQPDDHDYIKIVNTRTGCWSSVGKIGGPQEVNLQSPGCLSTVGTPVHELMHALGFHHEQTRYERDDFVDILWSNIRKGHEGNFAKVPKESATGFGVKYDYNSVMHYSAHAFSVNSQPTIVPKDKDVKIGQRDGFSVGDIIKIRNMYNCTKMEDSSNSKPGGSSSLLSSLNGFINNLIG